MLKTKRRSDVLPIVLRLGSVVDLTSDQFFELCRINRDLRLERTAEGDIVIMVPAGGETSHRNAELTTSLNLWAKQDGTGVVFDSSGGFELPNGATRAPDASWVQRSRLAHLSQEQKQKFLPVAPDFVIELRSPSDRLRYVQDKMQEYAENGVRLGWLIDPEQRQVHVYRSDGTVIVLDDPTTVSGDPVLPGFELDMQPIWEPVL